MTEAAQSPEAPEPAPSLSFEAHLAASLANLDALGLTRSTASRVPADKIDLTGNDTLGLGRDDDVRRRFLTHAEGRLFAFADDDASRPGELRFGSGASRILGGDPAVFDRLEKKLGDMYGRPGGVLLFQSGWHANSGILHALAAATPPKKTAFVADREVHASMIDGITMLRSQGVRVERFRHNDPSHLEHFVTKLEADHDVVWVALESLYSMSGDVAPLAFLPELKARHPKVRIILDEAHAFGAWGPQGLGLAAEAGVLSSIDVVIGTFGKALAAAGAFVATTPELRTWLVSRHRPFIYSTAMPPAEALWVEYALEQTEMMEARRFALARICGIVGGIGNPDAKYHVIPIPFPTVEALMKAQKALLRRGFAAAAVRPPTVRVPQLRISLSATLKPEDAEKLRSELLTLVETARRQAEKAEKAEKAKKATKTAQTEEDAR